MPRKLSVVAVLLLAGVMLAQPNAILYKYPKYVMGGNPWNQSTPYAVLGGVRPAIADTWYAYKPSCMSGGSPTNYRFWVDSSNLQGPSLAWANDNKQWRQCPLVRASHTVTDTSRVWASLRHSDASSGTKVGIRFTAALYPGNNMFSSTTADSATTLDMSTSGTGGWLAGHVYKAHYDSLRQNYAVLAYKRDTIVGSTYSEDNRIAEGGQNADPGYFAMAVKSGTIDSISIYYRTSYTSPSQHFTQIAPAWTVAAGCTTWVDSSLTVTVNPPASGAVWPVSSTQGISWTHSGGYNTADSVFYSNDGGMTWLFLGATAWPATTYSWTLPATGTNANGAQVRVKALNLMGNATGYSGFFTIMAVPVLVSPADNDTVGTQTPLLAWNSVGSGISYRIQVANNPGFTGAIEGTSSGTSWTVSSALAEGHWYWRVRGEVGSGYGDWSAARSFWVDVTPPAVPSYVGPAQDTTTNTLPNLDWSLVADARHYTVQLINQASGLPVPGFPVTVNQPSGDSSHYQLTSPLPDGIYQWRVNATDYAGNPSAYCSYHWFAVDRTPPEAPTLQSPIGGAMVETLLPLLEWSWVGDARSYYVELRNSSHTPIRSWTITQAAGSDNSEYQLQPGEELTDNTTYYWAVKSTDYATNQSGFSTEESFFVQLARHDVGTDAVNAPVDNSVHDPGLTVTPEAVLHNYGNRTDNIPALFTLSGGTAYSDRDTVTGVAPGGTPTVDFATTPALDPGYYTVTCQTQLAGDADPSNDVWIGHFLVIGTPAPTSPVNVWVNVRRPTFTWQALDAATAYDIEVSDDAGFSHIVWSGSGIAGLAVTAGTDLADGHYWWHLRGTNSGLAGGWCTAAEFDLDATPAVAPTLINPQDNATGVSTSPHFDWTSVTFDGGKHGTTPGTDAGSVGLTLPRATAGGSSVRITLPRALNASPDVSAKPGQVDASRIDYHLELADNPGFSPTIVDIPAVGETAYDYTGTPLAENSKYYWRVDAYDEVNPASAWATDSFTTLLSLPAVSITDPNGSTFWTIDSGADVNLVHSGGVAASDSILLSRDGGSTWTRLYYGATVSNYHISAVTAPATTNAEVRVLTRNAAGSNTATSARFTIQTALQVPAAFNLLTPANGATGVLQSGSLIWQASAGADSYHVYLGTSATPPAVGWIKPGSTTTYAYAGLMPGAVYHWHIDAVNAAGTTADNGGTWSFTTASGGPAPGWAQRAKVPTTPTLTGINYGSWLVNGGGFIYAAKGGKKQDFYKYDVDRDSWMTRQNWPMGTENKGPAKGAAACYDGSRYVYAVKGNNTVAFWRYDVVNDSWKQMARSVPLGFSNKKVKEGAGMAFVTKGSDGYVYLLKGYRNEFYAYDVAHDSWLTEPSAPATLPRYKAGSWVAFDGAQYLYAAQAMYHEFWRYDVTRDAWDRKLANYPAVYTINNPRGRSKKMKGGGCGAYVPGMVYSLKGGNTLEFFKYDVAGDSWASRESMPNMATYSVSKRKVKDGGAMTAYSGLIFAFKGGKTYEFWRYVPSWEYASQPYAGRSGVMAERIGSVRYGALVSPNPLSSGYATLSYTLPNAGAMAVTVHDVTGRTVMTKTVLASRTGSVALDLRSLNAGAYLVRITADGYSTAQKLVVQH